MQRTALHGGPVRSIDSLVLESDSSLEFIKEIGWSGLQRKSVELQNEGGSTLCQYTECAFYETTPP